MRLGALLYDGETGGEGDSSRRPGLLGTAAVKPEAEWDMTSEMDVTEVARTRALDKLIAGEVGRA